MAENTLNWKRLVVRVFVKTEGREQFRGTAFLINDEYLLTARHVIEPFWKSFEQNPDQIRLKNGPWDSTQFLAQAPIPHDNPKIDIALLRLRIPTKALPRPYPRLEDSMLDAGKSVDIAGFENEDAASSVSTFEVLAELNQYYSYALQNKGQHGKSGSPVILDDKIIGIFYARTDAPDSRHDQNESFIYPFSVFKDFLKKQGAIPEPPKQSEKPDLSPEMRAALINRSKQWHGHIKQRMRREKDRKNFAFVVAAVREEWPESLKYRLSLHLEQPKHSPLDLYPASKSAEDWKSNFQQELLKHFPLGYMDDEADFEHLEKRLVEQLSSSDTPLFYYCLLRPEVSKNHAYVQTIVSYWESLKLTRSEKQHVLLMIHGTKGKGFLSFGKREVEKWHKKLLKCLDKDAEMVVPVMVSPSREEVYHWISEELQDALEQSKFEKALKNLKGKRIPHLTLKETYINIAKPKAR